MKGNSGEILIVAADEHFVLGLYQCSAREYIMERWKIKVKQKFETMSMTSPNNQIKYFEIKQPHIDR